MKFYQTLIAMILFWILFGLIGSAQTTPYGGNNSIPPANNPPGFEPWYNPTVRNVDTTQYFCGHLHPHGVHDFTPNKWTLWECSWLCHAHDDIWICDICHINDSGMILIYKLTDDLPDFSRYKPVSWRTEGARIIMECRDHTSIESTFMWYFDPELKQLKLSRI